MRDAEYLFKQTAVERKRIGRGDFNKKRQGGKQVRLPSDNMSRKEWERMNGECKSFNMAKPVKWAAFKQWPADLQRNYLTGLQEKFNAKSGHMAAMFGVSTKTLFLLTQTIGFKFSRGKAPLRKSDWYAFVNGGPVKEEPVKEDPVKEELPPEVLATSEEETSAIKVQEPVKVDMTDPADLRIEYLCCLLTSLKGTGTVVELKIVI
jgi:hypothetical protein